MSSTPFTRDDVKNAIKNGTDDKDQYVAVTRDGKVVLVEIRKLQDNWEDYSTRFPEGFDSGNDCIGVNASKDDKHVDSVHDALEKGWKKFMKTGRHSIAW
ncbi:hypothetical protein [Paenibacillus polymyxa]|uniref:hypothetical protein n=1 Tax=Paenibacillus polymyxa TaxID=1406 RepID=UPI002378737B|nr:hypothetical protein [Paenibacillus polymyxa]WDM22284.1 hypothetical protein J4I02_01020 [Paenibacillus polymyxa]